MGELSVAEVLERAADLIEPEGAWTGQGGGRQFPKSCGTPTCMGLAIEQSADGRPLDPIMDALYLASPFGNVGELIRWNDAPARTQAEVVAKLREAAALAKARGQ